MSAAPGPLQAAIRLRAFELGVLELFGQGRLPGTVHTCLGQEAIATALAPHLDVAQDAFVASHRGHGHYLALGGPADALLAELAGRQGALCGGRAGSQHLQHARFFATGIQGGTAALATGLAAALARRAPGRIAVAQLGDGTLGEGAVYEAMTLAAMLRAPVLFLVEWNDVALATPTARTTRGDLLARFAGFGLDADRRGDQDPDALSAHLGRVIARVREGEPFVQIIDTRRLGPHSKGDDTRSAEALAALATGDPLSRLLEADPAARSALATERARFDALAAEVLARAPLAPGPASALPPGPARSSLRLHLDRPDAVRPTHYVDAVRGALAATLTADARALLLGQDIEDPYGGAFKATRGLSSEHPGRVISTPIAEAGTAGVAAGMALGGLRPVVEAMFSDFATLCSDALVNLAAKAHYTSDGRATCPVVLRLPTGGGRGYGPSHSQCLERLFCGVPGLRVLSLSVRHDPAAVWVALADEHGPVVLVEPKAAYARHAPAEPPIDLRAHATTSADGSYPPLCYVPERGPADVTVVTHGATTVAVEEAMRELVVELELRFDYFVLTQLWPLELGAVERSAARTGRVVVIEEETRGFGVAAAVLAELAERLPGLAVRAVGARALPIPAAPTLERAVLPGTDDVREALRALAGAPRRPGAAR